MFVVAPLHASGLIEAQGYGFALMLVLSGCVLVISGRPVAAGVILVAISVASAVAIRRLQQQSPVYIYLDAGAWLTIGITLIWVVSRAVFGPGTITYHRIMGEILLYLVIGVTFVPLYTFVGLLAPNAFVGLSIDSAASLGSQLIYFSFTTLTTIGYGDIPPVHPLARSLSNLEGIVGQLYPATLLARLVTLELEGRRR